MRTFGLTFCSIFLIGALSGGCQVAHDSGPGPAGPTTPTDTSYTASTPTFTTLSPTTASLGDSVTVFGKGFVDTAHGTLTLHLKGSFRDEAGNTTRVESLDLPMQYVSDGQAQFVFGPNVPFSPTGDTIGTFTGNFQVVSTLTAAADNGEVGDTFVSEARALAMTAGPSIYLDQIRSVQAGTNCQPVTTATAGSNDIALGTHLIGMAEATPDDPITYSFSFTSPGLQASYAQNKTYGFWPLDSSVPHYATDTGNFTFSTEITSGTSILIDPTQKEQAVTVNPPVKISQVSNNLTSVKLAKLSTGAYGGAGASYFTVTIKAQRRSGAALTRTLNFPVYSQIEIGQFEGVETEKHIYPSQLTDTGCSSAGVLGGSYTFTEGKSQQVNHTINMSWNMNQAVSFGLQAGVTVGFDLPLVGGADVNLSANSSDQWSQTFGVDVSQSVSSDTNSSVSLTIPQVLPGYVAASFIQLTTWERSVPVRYHSACGESGVIGTATLTSPKFNHGVNQGASCPPPAPPSIQTPNVGG